MPNQKPNPHSQKPIANPALVEALKTLHQENTPQNQGRVLGLVVEQAIFLAPAVITPAPQQGSDGRKQAAIQFQLITTKDGRPFFPAFTDQEELRKFTGERKVQSVALRFDDYVALIQRNEKACGFVVNPLGLSLTLDRKTVDNLAARKKEVAKLRQQQREQQQGAAFSQETIEKDTQVMVGDPEEVPQEMLEAVCEMARGREDIRTLWLRQMIRPDGTPSLIIVVDHTGVQGEVFEAVAEAARPHFGRLPVDMIPYGTSFAAAATEGVEPFYRREA